MKQNQKERENREIMILLSDAVKYRAKTFARPKKKKITRAKTSTSNPRRYNSP